MARRGAGINVPITGDSQPLRRELDEADGALGRFASGAGSKLRNIGGMIAGAFAVRAIVDFGQEMFALGSQIETTNVKIDTVFGDQAAAIREWADSNNEAFGLTDTQLAGLAANMADLLKPMGFTARDASAMAREALDLAGALSAWSGGTRTTAEVSEILTTAMLGEYEQLKTLGISINAAEVETRALMLAQAEGATEVTAMHEALAVQALILEKSTDAQTAWNDGSMDGIKTQNELTAAFAEVREELATALYPILIDVGEWIVGSLIPWIKTGLIPRLQDWWAWISIYIVPALRALWKWLSTDVVKAIQTAVHWIKTELVPALVGLWTWIKKNVVPTMEEMASTVGTGLTYAFAGFIAYYYSYIKPMFDDMLSAVREIVRFLVPISDALGAAGGNSGDLITGPIGGAIQGATGGIGGINNGGGGNIGRGIGVGIPKLAAGGIVTGPTLALIGEAGPEAVIPLGSGGGMGNTYNISVQALDPGQASTAVIEAIRTYERRNGAYWRAA